MRIRERFALGLFAAAVAGTTQAAISVPMHAVDEDGVGERVGQITVSESDHGLVFTPATGRPGRRHPRLPSAPERFL